MLLTSIIACGLVFLKYHLNSLTCIIGWSKLETVIQSVVRLVRVNFLNVPLINFMTIHVNDCLILCYIDCLTLLFSVACTTYI